jgi:hypothetical protein
VCLLSRSSTQPVARARVSSDSSAASDCLPIVYPPTIATRDTAARVSSDSSRAGTGFGACATAVLTAAIVGGHPIGKHSEAASAAVAAGVSDWLVDASSAPFNQSG